MPLISTRSFTLSRSPSRSLYLVLPRSDRKTFILDSEIRALILAACSVGLRRFATIRPVTLRINGVGKLHRGCNLDHGRGRHRHSPTTRPLDPRSPPRADKFKRMHPAQETVESVPVIDNDKPRRFRIFQRD